MLGPGLVEGAMCGPYVRLLGGECEEGLKCVRGNRYYGICQKDEGQAIESKMLYSKQKQKRLQQLVEYNIIMNLLLKKFKYFN